jgi:signal transduction histidine kinase
MNQILENLPVGLIVRRGDGSCRWVNSVACDLLGIKFDSVVDRGNLADLLERDIRWVCEGDEGVLLTGSPLAKQLRATICGVSRTLLLSKFRTETGEPRQPAVATLIAELTPETSPLGPTGIGQRSLEARLEKQREFIGLLSHEFRTPISVLQGTHHLLSKLEESGSQSGSQERQRILDLQKQALVNLQRQVDQVLMLRRAELPRLNSSMKAVAITELTQCVVNHFNGALPTARVELRDLLPPGTELVTDPGVFRAALENLVSNALKYSPDHTKVTVTLQAKDHQLILEVTDRGCGIPEADQASLSQPFFRASNTARIAGTGLGLTIVLRFAELQGGKMTFFSALGQGSAFRLCVPLRHDNS